MNKNSFTFICPGIIHSVMVVFFGIYAFNNPEEGVECYVSDIFGPDQPFHSTLTTGDNYTDVGKRYHTVFVCGFVLSLINLLKCAHDYHLYTLGKFTENKIILCTWMIVGNLTLALLIYASIVIFSSSGQLCREYQ